MFGKVDKIKNLLKIASMATTKLVSRRTYFDRRKQFLSGQRPIGNKIILNRRVRDRRIKIKKVLPQFKNVEAKRRSSVAREMIVRRNTRYPDIKCRQQY